MSIEKERMFWRRAIYLCNAEEIEVRSSEKNRVVNSTDGTACETFKPKDAPLINPKK